MKITLCALLVASSLWSKAITFDIFLIEGANEHAVSKTMDIPIPAVDAPQMSVSLKGIKNLEDLSISKKSKARGYPHSYFTFHLEGSKVFIHPNYPVPFQAQAPLTPQYIQMLLMFEKDVVNFDYFIKVFSFPNFQSLKPLFDHFYFLSPYLQTAALAAFAQQFVQGSAFERERIYLSLKEITQYNPNRLLKQKLQYTNAVILDLNMQSFCGSYFENEAFLSFVFEMELALNLSPLSCEFLDVHKAVH